MNKNLDAVSQLWSGVEIVVVTIVKRRANQTRLDPITEVVVLQSLKLIPLALKMSHASGTQKVTCP